jgi:hypothetical protein
MYVSISNAETTFGNTKASCVPDAIAASNHAPPLERSVLQSSVAFILPFRQIMLEL